MHDLKDGVFFLSVGVAALYFVFSHIGNGRHLENEGVAVLSNYLDSGWSHKPIYLELICTE